MPPKSTPKPAAKPGKTVAKAPASRLAKIPAKQATPQPAATTAAPAPATAKPADEPTVPPTPAIIRVPLPQLAVQVIEDAPGRYSGDGEGAVRKWPCVIDPSRRTMTFLRYRDANCIDVCDPSEFDPAAIRRLLLGALRFGKPLVIDLHDTTMMSLVAERVNAVQPGLWSKLLSREVLEQRVWETLLTPDDNAEVYAPLKWTAAQSAGFRVILCAQGMPPDVHPEEFLFYEIPE